MIRRLDDLKIAMLVAQGFEQVELEEPKKALEEAGARVFIISPEESEVRGWNFTEWGNNFEVDFPLEKAYPAEFDALVLPGGVMNPDKLRDIPLAVEFVKSFFDAGKPVAAICHAPWILINAGVVKNKKITSWPSLKEDLVNAGAHWIDKEVVKDGNLITSRNPEDIPAFNKAVIELISQYYNKR